MTKRKVLKAKKYEVILNEHLVSEILDRMPLPSFRRGIIVRGLGCINIALTKAIRHPEDFSRSALTAIAVTRQDHRHLVTLTELVLILDDVHAMQDVHTYGNHFGFPAFGAATKQAVNDFVDAAITSVDHGLFRP